MAYRIEYDGRAGKYEVINHNRPFPVLVVAGIIMLLTLTLWQEGREAFLSWIIPGEDTVTVQAFSAMTDNLRSGAALSSALEDFCRAIIYGQ